MRIVWFLTILLALVSGTHSPIAVAQQTKGAFTVADEIGLTLFGDPYVAPSAIQFSPNGTYFAVWSERGRLDINRPEDSLRFYRSREVDDFLKNPNRAGPPSPVWLVTLSTNKEGSSIGRWRWLEDSSGVAFLSYTPRHNHQLVVADLPKRTIEPLTSPSEEVGAFDIRDRQHYVYTLADPALSHRIRERRRSGMIVGTNRSLFDLLFPDDLRLDSRRRCLWAVVGGKRFEVKHNNEPIVLDGAIGLSPDGGLLVATLPVPEVPSSWKILYPPPYESDPDRYHGGAMHQYVLINLQMGSIQSLADAPISSDAGSWAWVFGDPSWSKDGQSVLLPGTFLRSKDNLPSQPCVAVANLRSNTSACVERLKGHTEKDVEDGYHGITEARFIGGDRQSVMVISRNHLDSSLETATYRHASDGTWRLTNQIKGTSEVGADGLKIALMQGLNQAPLIVATRGRVTRTVWDPNPKLKDIELGEASVYKWKDKEGRDWRGGLFKPIAYQRGQRYPLVIQTHGFLESEFVPSGVYPTAFAARELAAIGIVVLQVREQCPEVTVYEGPCAVSGYEGAARQLTAEGLVDSEKIGIVGFSRTGFYVMETLTTSSVHFEAASVTDSFMLDYFQYMLNPERGAHEDNAMIGAPPFGEGLQQWVKRSPSFNLDKITSPLLLVGSGPLGLLFMWEPYAGLHCLHKPVDLIMLKTQEHVLSNPAVRMASQGGTVDWFRFWLKGEEDQDPTKAQQYTRWRALRKLRGEKEDKSVTSSNSN